MNIIITNRKSPNDILLAKFPNGLKINDYCSVERCVYADVFKDPYFNDVSTVDFPINKVSGLLAQYIKLVYCHFSTEENIKFVPNQRLTIGNILAFAKMILTVKDLDFLSWFEQEKENFPTVSFKKLEPIFEKPEVLEYFPILTARYIDTRCLEAENALNSYNEFTFDDLHQTIKANYNSFMEVDRMNFNEPSLGVDVPKKKSEILFGNFTPAKIMENLRKRVYGQDEALEQISLMAYSHLKRVIYPEMHMKKQNYMLLGPTGSGKTEIARALKEIMPVPVVTLNMACVTPNGYRGISCDQLLCKEIEPYSSHKYVNYTIVVLDEFDKLIKKTHDNNNNVYGEEIQGDLLKIIEGTNVIADGLDNSRLSDPINTENMLFICAGAFENLFDDENVVVGDAAVSFINSKVSDFNDSEIREKLISYGFMRELLGRIGNFTFINSLTADDFVHIMTHIDGSMLASIKTECELANAKFNYTDKALLEAANCAMKQQLGVRGMEHIIKKATSKSLIAAANGQSKNVSLTVNSVKEAIS